MQLFFLFITLFSFVAFAKSDEQIIREATKENEHQLLSKYNIIQSQWFEQSCMELAKQMKFNKIVQCKMFNSKHINAYVLANGHVYFSQAMMQQINNKHQWASILAHENAHLELNHYLKTLKKIQSPGVFFPKSKIRKIMKKHEKQADAWARQRLSQYGFDPEQIFFFLTRVSKINSDETKTHFKLSKRIKKSTAIEPELLNKDLKNKLNEIKIFQLQ